jgi:hypothetical protein
LSPLSRLNKGELGDALKGNTSTGKIVEVVEYGGWFLCCVLA